MEALIEGLHCLRFDEEASLKHLGLSSPETLCLLASVEAEKAETPTSFKAAVESGESDFWKEAMQQEVESLLENGTFDLQTSHNTSRSRPLSAKWVFTRKLNADDTTRYKARLVVRGCAQEEGVNFGATYAPVATQTTFRLLLALASIQGWPIQQLDVVTAFLHPKVDCDDIWVRIPEGIRKILKWPHAAILRLEKALYGLRQSPRLWWQKIDEALRAMGLVRGENDTNVYFGKRIIVLLYVDDILIFDMTPKCNDATILGPKQITEKLTSLFKMKDLGPLRRFLGYEVTQYETGIKLSQQKYAETIVERYKAESSAPTFAPADDKLRIDHGYRVDQRLDEVETQRYQSIVGAMLYAALGTRPDIAFTVSALSRHCANPTKSHFTAARHLLRYINTTQDLSLVYPSKAPIEIRGFCDADWGSSEIDRRSIGGYAFYLGNSLISWKAKRQTLRALSSVEAELMACSEATREATWLKSMLAEVMSYMGTSTGFTDPPILIGCDNQGTLKLITKGVMNASSRTKHIELRHWHAREQQERGIVKFFYVNTKVNVADVLTKELHALRHGELIRMLNMRTITDTSDDFEEIANVSPMEPVGQDDDDTQTPILPPKPTFRTTKRNTNRR